MLRNGASRLALRSVAAPTSVRSATCFSRTAPSLQWQTQFGSLAAKRPQLRQAASALKPASSAILRRCMADGKLTEGQKQAESRYRNEKIEPTPETVTSSSTTHPIFSEIGTADDPQKDVDMMADMKHDLNTVKDTFSLAAVPREAFYLGLAGTLPYLATSISTVYLSWELNHSVAGYGFMISEKNATYLLHLIEPLQVGYGASILSFLGAIHWGLEWAGYGGYQGYKRYAIGVVTPMVAWSTLMMPIEGALITQFLSFTALYYVDTRAAYRGWTPDWYAVYRFVLTMIVGASILVTLIGRSELPEHIPGSVDRAKVFKEDGSPEEKLAAHEKALAEKKKNAARSDDRGKH